MNQEWDVVGVTALAHSGKKGAACVGGSSDRRGSTIVVCVPTSTAASSTATATGRPIVWSPVNKPRT
jgi:hypothetical protein